MLRHARKEELLEKPPSSPYRLRKKTKGTSSSNAPGTSPVEHPPPLEERGNVVGAGAALGAASKAMAVRLCTVPFTKPSRS